MGAVGKVVLAARHLLLFAKVVELEATGACHARTKTTSTAGAAHPWLMQVLMLLLHCIRASLYLLPCF